MKIHHLFISHSWSHSNHYKGLVELLKKKNRFYFSDYSVPKDDPIHNAGSDSELKAAIKNKMALCGTILILAGVYSTYSKWIDIEINLAQKGFISPKPIIAIKPWASTNTSIPVKEAANRIVGWNTDPIVNAIRELS